MVGLRQFSGLQTTDTERNNRFSSLQHKFTIIEDGHCGLVEGTVKVCNCFSYFDFISRIRLMESYMMPDPSQGHGEKREPGFGILRLRPVD